MKVLYTFTWVDEEETEILGGQKIFPSPMREPLKLVPQEVRKKFLEDLNKGFDSGTKVKIKGKCAQPILYLSSYMDKYDGDWEKVMKHVEVEDYFFLKRQSGDWYLST